jgi:hypothetical protein
MGERGICSSENVVKVGGGDVNKEMGMENGPKKRGIK